MNRIQVPPLTEDQLSELEDLYHKTKKPRYRTRAQMVLLSAEKNLKAEEVAQIVRESHISVLRWLKRYLAEGIEGLMDSPRSGRSTTVTDDYRKRLLEIVHRRPDLIPDKPAALQEMARVLKPGGRLQIGDILVQKAVPESAKHKIDLWTG